MTRKPPEYGEPDPDLRAARMRIRAWIDSWLEDNR
jgi:hypothetical protein